MTNMRRANNDFWANLGDFLVWLGNTALKYGPFVIAAGTFINWAVDEGYLT
jgi:hypothetical protein